MNSALITPAAAAPALAGLSHLMPWWAAIPASLGPAAYICRQYLQYKLNSKALDKAPPGDIAAIITAINTPGPDPRAARPGRQASRRSATSKLHARSMK
jgi:hypothetical protein